MFHCLVVSSAEEGDHTHIAHTADPDFIRYLLSDRTSFQILVNQWCDSSTDFDDDDASVEDADSAARFPELEKSIVVAIDMGAVSSGNSIGVRRLMQPGCWEAVQMRRRRTSSCC